MVIPLNVLLSHALLDLTRACEHAGADEVVLWSNVRVSSPLLVGVHFDSGFADGGMPFVEAPVALAITGTGRSSLERHGLVTVDRSKRVTLTSRGRQARASYRPLVEAIEASWSAAPALRDALEALGVHDTGHADHPDVRYVGGHVGFAEASTRR